MLPIACNIEHPHDNPGIKTCRLRFDLPYNAELLLYDDFTTLHAVKLEFDALDPAEQRAYIMAVLAEKLSP